MKRIFPFLLFVILVSILPFSSCSHPTIRDRFKSYPVSFRPNKPVLVIDTRGHNARIRDIMFTRDGRHLVSASYDKMVMVWDVSTGEVTRVLRGQIGPGDKGKIYAADLSPDDKLLAVGGWIGDLHSRVAAIRLFNFQTGEVIALLEGHGDVILDLAFSPDGSRLISGSFDKTARIWDVRSGKPLQVLTGHKHYIYAVAFSPDGTRAVTASYDHTLRLWDVASGYLTKILRHIDRVRSVAFTPDGRYILSGSHDKTIRLWDGRTGEFIKVLARQNRAVHSLTISPDGTKVLTGHSFGSGDFVNNVFSIPSGERVTSFTKHRDQVLATAISPDGKTAATAGGSDMEIYLWDLATGSVKQKMAGKGKRISSVGFAEDGRSIAWGWTFRRNRYLFGTYRLEQSFQIRGDAGNFSLALGKELVEDTCYIRGLKAAGTWSIRTKTGKPHSSLQILKNGSVVYEIVRHSLAGFMHESLTLTPNGQVVVSGGRNGRLASYDPRTGNILHDFVGHTDSVWDVAISPDSRYLVSGSEDQTVRLWEVATGKLLLTIFHGTDNEWVAWTPEGFYTSSPKGDQYVGWHVNRGKDKSAEYFTANQFRRYLYRPDIVADTLRLGSSKKAIARAGMDKITVGMLIQRAPVNIKMASVKMKGDEEAEITVQLSKNRVTTPERITLYVNGAQMLTNPERVLVGVKPGDTLRYQVKLLDKKNHIRVLVENQWAETGHEMWYENDNWKQSDQLKGTLYLNAAGINRYPKFPARQQLRSPNLDARSIVERFSKLEGKLYRNVVSHLLTDNDGQYITAARIEKLLTEQSQKAGPNDTSLFFLAGHGVTDSKGDYHLVTADSAMNISDSDINLTGGATFDWKRLHKILDHTVGKRIVIVDTCQAGSVFSTNKVDIQKLVKDIHDVNAIVYSGSSRQQSALETSKGGVFTETILDGIDGKASYENGRLLFTALREYVDVEVPKRNREIMQSIYRSIKIKKKQRKDMDFDSTQKTVSVIPDGMNGFVIYKK